jgi:hypothetical protein
MITYRCIAIRRVVWGQSALAAGLYIKAEDSAARYGWVPSLNGLRAASILLVLFGHLVLLKLGSGPQYSLD